MSLIPRKYYLDSIFDDFFMEEGHTSQMKCDIYEKDGDYHVELDIPGFNKDDIKIECHDGYLTVVAEKCDSSVDEGKNYIKRERVCGKVQRQFYVGDIDVDKVKAEFKNGILKVVVPKEEKNIAKKHIEIE